ncbi:MAG: phosphoadenylyl-sulfate reductase [Candidatus Helarchaeota archaeon]
MVDRSKTIITPTLSNLNEIAEKLEEKSPQEILIWAISIFKEKIVLATSLGAEDQVLADMVTKINPQIPIFFLDTGRIHQETYNVLEETRLKYKIKIKTLFPQTSSIEKFEYEEGPNPFYKSIELRRKCCQIRKVEPLKRALHGFNAWITGLRRSQSITRVNTKKIEWDSENKIYKINPLADWTEKQVWDYIQQNDIPYNKLHDQGYPSIGCIPCTRSIKPGEDIRAGRWWWETPEKRECGLHVHKEEE